MLKYLFTLLMFFVILLEEAFWSIFEMLSGLLTRFELVRRLENFVAARSPVLCLTLFLIPVLMMLPFKFAGVWLMAHGHTLEGLFMFLSAKASGTFLAARLFAITKDKLMSIAWFAYSFEKFYDWKEGVKTYIHATKAYRTYLIWRTALNVRVAAIFKRKE